MDEKRFQVLCSGLLAKSPAKSKAKAHLPGCWQLRWCVLTLESNGDRYPQLVLDYYQSEDCFRENPKMSKGSLDIRNCLHISSCFESQSGFDHIFSVECADGKFVKFSAPSCRLKSQWIHSLYYYKLCCLQETFGSSGKVIRRLGSKSENESSIRTRLRSSGADSGNGSLDSIELDQPTKHNRQTVGTLSTILESKLSLIDRLVQQNANLQPKAREVQQIATQKVISDLFMLCEACTKKRTRPSLTRKMSEKKRRSLYSSKDHVIKPVGDVIHSGSVQADEKSIGSEWWNDTDSWESFHSGETKLNRDVEFSDIEDEESLDEVQELTEEGCKASGGKEYNDHGYVEMSGDFLEKFWEASRRISAEEHAAVAGKHAAAVEEPAGQRDHVCSAERCPSENAEGGMMYTDDVLEKAFFEMAI